MVRCTACLYGAMAALVLSAGSRAQTADVLPAADTLLYVPPTDKTLPSAQAAPPPMAQPSGPPEESTMSAPEPASTVVTPEVLYGPPQPVGTGSDAGRGSVVSRIFLKLRQLALARFA